MDRLPLPISNDGGQVSFAVETFGKGAVELDYAEIFPNQFPVALGPGSSVLGDEDVVTIEGPLKADPPKLTVNGRDVKLADLLADHSATRDDTTYRSLYSVTVGTLAAGDATDLDVFATAPSDSAPTARGLYHRAPPCMFAGDAGGRKVLLTGFQTFPVAETHENVSGVAVTALDPSTLMGAQVMRLVIPVEYDNAPAIVASAITRCAPDVVISFGQGDGAIDLEHTAFNLKDTPAKTPTTATRQAGAVPIDPSAPTSPHRRCRSIASCRRSPRCRKTACSARSPSSTATIPAATFATTRSSPT